MDGWRISKRRYANPPAAAFDGEGSRRRGGRWTPPGKRVAYASSSLALASLEYFVNLDPQDRPSGLVYVYTSIPEGIRWERVNISFPSRIVARGAVSAGTLGVGESWLVAGSSVCLLVPSAVVPEEFNLLINPLHSDFRVLRFSDPSVFNFDPRMWKRS